MKIIDYVGKKLGSVLSPIANPSLDYFEKKLAESYIGLKITGKNNDTAKKVLDDISLIRNEQAEVLLRNKGLSEKIKKHKKSIAIASAVALGLSGLAAYELIKEKQQNSAVVNVIPMYGYELKKYADGSFKCEAKPDHDDIVASGGIWKKYPEWKARTPIGDNDLVFKFNPADGTPFVAYMGLNDINWKENYFKAKLVVDEDFIKTNGNNLNVQGKIIPVDFKKVDDRGVYEGELKIDFSEQAKNRFLKYHEELPGVIVKGGKFPAVIDIEYSPSDLFDYLFGF